MRVKALTKVEREGLRRNFYEALPKGHDELSDAIRTMRQNLW